MSAIKKGLKKVGKFLKKHWKPIAMVAATVFTAGIATVGAAGFTGAMDAAGGGLTGLLSATGSTLWAGATSIAGTFGIGSGAQGTAAAYGAAAGHGGTLTTGALAKGLGFSSAGISTQAQQAAQKALDSGQGWKDALNASRTATNATGLMNETKYGAGAPPKPPAGGAGKPDPKAPGGSGGLMNGAQQGQGGDQPTLQIGYQGPTMGQTIAQAAIPAAFNMAGAYMQAEGMADAQEPQQSWGYDIETGQVYGPQPGPQGLMDAAAAPDPRIYQPAAPRAPRPMRRRPM